MESNKKLTYVPWIAEDYKKNKLTLQDVQFIFSQAEKLLRDSVDTSEVIVSRTSTLVTVIAGLLVGFTGFIITQFTRATKFDNIFYTTGIGILYLYIVLLYTHRNLKPKTYLIDGSLPIDLFNDGFFIAQVKDEKRILQYYVNEIENYQDNIVKNNFINEKRWSIYKTTIFLIIIFPVILGACYALLKLLF